MWLKSYISNENVPHMVRDAREFALINGLVTRLRDVESDNMVVHLPFTLFPTPFPRRLYDECLAVQPIINKLLIKLACDVPFINEVLSDMSEYDVFTRKLLAISRECQREGNAQPIQSCISRSDYMLDMYQTGDGNTSLRARQVEINSIACGQATSSQNATMLHDYIRSKYKLDAYNSAGHLYPKNEAGDLVAAGLIDAYDLYGKAGSFILLANEPRNYNFNDHLRLELIVRKLRPDIPFIRRKFNGIEESVKLGPNKELLVDGNKEIAVVYLRYSYDSSHYNVNTDNAWSLKLLIERSRAIKCPSINIHLAGAKKFQQVLASEEKLEKYLDASDSTRLARTFCRFWSLDSATNEGKEGYSEGLNNYDKLVMKPQREGGGHNFFGREIVDTFEKLDRNELSQFILMELINSPKEKNWLLTNRHDLSSDAKIIESSSDLVSELGIYGSVIASGGEILSSKSSGYLVRSKTFGAKENGVASGFAGLSSLVLIDDTRAELDMRSFYNESL